MCRPRRFGKTLALSTVEHFLSTRVAGRGEELFGGLAVWDDSAMRELQGTVPVVMVSFDAANAASEASEPERFNHGLMLGLLMELRGRYEVESNRESGYGRYDVMLVPNDGADAAGGADPAIVIEFKVQSPRRGEHALEDAVASARARIAERAYAASLEERGIGRQRIHEYGIAFSGKDVLVG